MINRKLQPQDLKAYRALRLEVIRSAPTAFTSSAEEEQELPDESLLADIVPAGPGCVIGAFTDDGLVGVAGLRPEKRSQASHKGLLFGMAIRPDRQGQGIGRSLIEAVLSEARVIGLLQVVLSYSAGNTPAERLYTSCGFTEFGREPRAVIVDGTGIVKVHMVRQLDSPDDLATGPAFCDRSLQG